MIIQSNPSSVNLDGTNVTSKDIVNGKTAYDIKGKPITGDSAIGISDDNGTEHYQLKSTDCLYKDSKGYYYKYISEEKDGVITQKITPIII